MRFAATLLYILSIGVAAVLSVEAGFVPLGSLVHPDLRLAYSVDPLAIELHFFTVAVALILAPFQFSAWLQPAGKRPLWIEHAYLLVGVYGGALSGLVLSQYVFADLATRLGFALLASLWFFTGLRTYVTIYTGNATARREWIIRSVAMTCSAITLRLWLSAAAGAGVGFELAYPVISWLCWVPNLIVAELLIRSKRGPVEATP